MDLIPPELQFGRLTTDEWASLLSGAEPVVILLPVGAIEPHGPHLALETDVVISQGAAVLAAHSLRERSYQAFIAPALPYGVTNCAAGFKGAVSVSEEALIGMINSLVSSLLDDGVRHVAVINNHLEPAHDSAVRKAVAPLGPTRASVCSPLVRRWARTLSEEFKRGECHAGCYETSLILATAPDLVRQEVSRTLAEVPVSLSERLRAGVTDFEEMGLARAYAGAPAQATEAHGQEQLGLLATMITTQIEEALSATA